MAQCKLTIGIKRRWLARQGIVGLGITLLAMKAGLPFGWFFATTVTNG